MSSAVIVGDRNLGQAATGYNADQAVKASIKTASNTKLEPPISAIGNIWPTDGLWHPLYDSDKAEILDYIIDQPTEEVVRVGNIVKQIPKMHGIKSLTVCLLICFIILIIALVTGSKTAYYVLAGMGGLAVCIALYTFLIAPSIGESNWVALEKEIEGGIKAGKTVSALRDEALKTRELKAQNDAMILAAQQASFNNRYNTGNGIRIGGLPISFG